VADPRLLISPPVILAKARIQGSLWLLLFSFQSPGGRPGAAHLFFYLVIPAQAGIQGRRWQTGSWLLSLVRPREK